MADVLSDYYDPAGQEGGAYFPNFSVQSPTEYADSASSGWGGWGDLFGGSSSGGGSSWGGFSQLGKDILGGVLPGLAGMGVGALANKLMPGTPQKLVDTRTPEQQGLARTGFSALQTLQQHPNSFGLPGDPEDPNSPAGRKLYGIRQQSRSADAARGMFTTGGSAQRETNAIQDSANNAFATLAKTYGDQAGVGGMNLTAAQENPWAKLLTGFGGPALSGATSNILSRYGFSAPNPYQVRA